MQPQCTSAGYKLLETLISPSIKASRNLCWARRVSLLGSIERSAFYPSGIDTRRHTLDLAVIINLQLGVENN
jgi:hypothetical protein